MKKLSICCHCTHILHVCFQVVTVLSLKSRYGRTIDGIFLYRSFDPLFYRWDNNLFNSGDKQRNFIWRPESYFVINLHESLKGSQFSFHISFKNRNYWCLFYLSAFFRCEYIFNGGFMSSLPKFFSQNKHEGVIFLERQGTHPCFKYLVEYRHNNFFFRGYHLNPNERS